MGKAQGTAQLAEDRPWASGRESLREGGLGRAAEGETDTGGGVPSCGVDDGGRRLGAMGIADDVLCRQEGPIRLVATAQAVVSMPVTGGLEAVAAMLPVGTAVVDRAGVAVRIQLCPVAQLGAVVMARHPRHGGEEEAERQGQGAVASHTHRGSL